MISANHHLCLLGLVRNPFPYTPDAGCYFLTRDLREQMIELAHCILARKGFLLLTAEVGMGKSTLVRRLMIDLAPQNVVSALVFNTFLQGPELLSAVLQDFGLTSSGSMAVDIAELNSFLLRHHQQGKTCLLIIDDAQNLSDASLELIRLLCNLETDQEKLLQILLAGQPELEAKLSQHNLRQLRSRVAKHSRLRTFDVAEIADYVNYRFASAGQPKALVMHANACSLLALKTRGVPRQIHLVMDRCLYELVATATTVIDVAAMKSAIGDLDNEAITPSVDDSRVVMRREAEKRESSFRWGYAACFTVALLVSVGAYLSVPGINLAVAAQPTASLPVVNVQTVGSQVAPAAGAVSVIPSLATSAPVVTAVVPAAIAQQPTCKAQSGWPTDSQLRSQALSEVTAQLLGSRLALVSGVCVEQQKNETWLTWIPAPADYPVTERATAAALQIALTRFGSLPPEEIDGVWGEKSRAAVYQFQARVGLIPTGDVDSLSGLLLEKLYVRQQ